MNGKKIDLVAKVREQTVRSIHEMFLHGERKLPSENELADRFQVSRTTVRTVLARLEAEGKVLRKHGSGTYVNEYAFEINTTLYPQVYFWDLIVRSGYNPSIEILGARVIKAGDRGSRLHVPSNRDLFEVRKIYKAADEMCIYCIDYLNPAHFKNRKLVLDVLQSQTVSIFRILQNYANRPIKWDVVRLGVSTADEMEELQKYSAYDRPYLVIDTVNYDESDEPVLYAHSFLNNDMINYYLVRGRFEPEVENV